ncbi:SUN-domain-containing protein [Lindgomyces ingoldianus]|uniref:SUN-domain-containing protein n=1 Tax=Lindgomyces ingoldianus TaxID=673940 RepID=A0ACB6QSX0_9PLEO|nr:SUN-domain-containing protein [Lindgomyces ingoldianus]KAF2470084.1 SUN-domain-containing protein [Lindgomyces ingoldianus]
MKFAVIVAVIAALAAAQPHGHSHRHGSRSLSKRSLVKAAVYAPGPVETVIVYELDGHKISEQEVRQGIANGTLVWGDDGNLSSSAVATATLTSTPIVEATSAAKPTATSTVQDHSSAPAAPVPSKSPQSQPASANNNGDCPDCDKEFPNGHLPCNRFPSGYGALPLDHLGLAGWAGVQNPGFSGADGFGKIETAPIGTCKDGSCCKPGTYCSYGCSANYLKASWPKLQGTTKESVGGLYCNNDGMLEMADGSIAKTLCVKGTDKVTVKIRNKLNKPVSICRTDYPGKLITSTEGETIPLTVGPGEEAVVATPDESKYYHHFGKETSAQYYINPAGVSEKDACWWTDGSKPQGNWAPVNLGAGYGGDGGHYAYISLQPNRPTTNAELDYTVELIADDMDGKCKYANGQYWTGEGYKDSVDGGCTVSTNIFADYDALTQASVELSQIWHPLC